MSGLRLNLGSGQRPFGAGWTNVDCQAKWQPDVIAQCEALPFADESAEICVLHHVLEHYGCGEGLGALREAYRVLKPGGSLLVMVPDMRALAQRWLMGELDTETYLINVYGAYMGAEADRHRFGFVSQTLRKQLEQAASWSVVKVFNWRPIAGMDAALDWWVLALEAVK